MKAYRLFSILFFYLLISIEASAQVKVNNNGTICIGNLASFSYAPPPGVNITRYQWSFGDGFTSNNSAPNHLYKATGSFTVQVIATKVGGGTLNGSVAVKVVGLPKANFVMTSSSDSCSTNNNICFKDLSLPAKPGQNITSRLTIWGDGAYDKNSQPNSAALSCHHYKAVDKFNISIEITDRLGCKDFVSKSIQIIPGIEAAMNTKVSYPKCGEAKLCVKNTSVQANGINANYEWEFNNKKSNQSFINNPYCTTTTSAAHYDLKLTAKSANGCIDTVTQSLDLVADTGQRTLHSTFSEICYGDNSAIRFNVDHLPNDSITWWVNDSLYGNQKTSALLLTTKWNKLLPGLHTIKCRIIRGNCVTLLQKKLRVKGPVAKIEIFNQNQCGPFRKVFFVGDQNERFTPNYSYKWELTDHQGLSCIADRANDLNKYTNCNSSTDWWHKHQYTDQINGYLVRLRVNDTIICCADSVSSFVNMDACGRCLDPCTPRNICQNTWIFSKTRVPSDPIKVTFDSGATWVNYPVFLDSSYLGTYDVGYIFKYTNPSYAEDFGDDSIRIVRDTQVYSDTILCDNNLPVLPNRKNSFTLSAGASCNPLEIVAHLEKRKFTAGDRIVFTWADSMKLIITATVDFTLDSVILNIDASGYNGSIRARFSSNQACFFEYTDSIKVGHNTELMLKGPLCVNNQICLDAKVKANSNNAYWTKQNNLGSARWMLDSILQKETDFQVCPSILKAGLHEINLILESAEGCNDTIQKRFVVQEVKANVTNDSRNFYCNQLRQFFDSSEIVFKDSADRISNYLWDFGTGNYTTLEKDPFRSFVGAVDDIHVSHIVETKSGCRDTVDFVLGIIGSKPKFIIKDSVGCAPYEITFFNQSQNASQYIWSLGIIPTQRTIPSTPVMLSLNIRNQDAILLI